MITKKVQQEFLWNFKRFDLNWPNSFELLTRIKTGCVQEELWNVFFWVVENFHFYVVTKIKENVFFARSERKYLRWHGFGGKSFCKISSKYLFLHGDNLSSISAIGEIILPTQQEIITTNYFWVVATCQKFSEFWQQWFRELSLNFSFNFSEKISNIKLFY